MTVISDGEVSTSTMVAGGGGAAFLTVRHLRAAGDNRAIGRAVARAARQAHGAAAGPRPAPDRRVQRARRSWFDANHPVLAERMLGVGEVFGVDARGDDWDLAWLGSFELPAGCSAVFYPGGGTRSGHALLARNFDFPTLTYSEIICGAAHPGEGALAAEPWIVELHPDRGYASITIGIMDVMGAMDGVNEAGLAVTLLADNESPSAEPSGVPQVGLSEQQIVRYLLDTCATADEAQHALLMAKQYYLFTPCHFLVADRAGQAFVWEYSPGHNREHIVGNAAAVGGGWSARTICCTAGPIRRGCRARPAPAAPQPSPTSDGGPCRNMQRAARSSTRTTSGCSSPGSDSRRRCRAPAPSGRPPTT
jgi:hypothetical protein